MVLKFHYQKMSKQMDPSLRKSFTQTTYEMTRIHWAK